MMTLLTHPDWPILLPYLRVETYDRDGGHSDPRHRIEVNAPRDGVTLRALLAIETPCVACGHPVHPVRQRQSASVHLYLAVTCGLDVRYGCARSAAAAAEYVRIVEAVRGRVVPEAQPSLF